GDVAHLRDELLDLGELARRAGLDRDRLRLAATHREQPLDDLALLHLLCRRGRELGIRPDGPPADLLAGRELRVRVADDLLDRRALLRLEEDRVDLQRLAGTLEADHGREDGTLRSRERLDPWVGGEDVLDVLGVDLGTSGNDVAEPAAELAVDAEEDESPESHRKAPRDAPQALEELALAFLLRAPLDRDEERAHRGRGDEDHRHMALAKRAAHHRRLAAR